jgi:hypothetical protein
MSEEVPCKMSRACSYPCTNQGFDQICVLLSIINTLAHNICSQMKWTTPDYKMDKPFDLTTNCNHECGDPTSSNCKCCLLRIYIRTIILNEFPSIIEKGVNTEAVISFVDLFFNELLLLTENLGELHETIKKHLYGYKDGNDKLVSDLTNIFAEIKDRANFIIFYKFYIKKGILYDDQDEECSYLKELLKQNDLYAIIDDHSPVFLRFLVTEIKNTPELDPSSIQYIQSILCGNDQDKINEFMTSYLKKKMKNSDKSMSDIFSELKEQVAAIDMDISNKTVGHAMVLKCIFSYDGSDDESDDWGYYKNSWGSEIEFAGHNFAPLKVFSHCGIYLPKLLKLIDRKYLSDKKKEIREKILDRQKKEEAARQQQIEEQESLALFEAEEAEAAEEARLKAEAAQQEEDRLRAIAQAEEDAEEDAEEVNQQLLNQQAHQQAQQVVVNQQLLNQQAVRQKRGSKGMDSLQKLPKNTGGNRSSKKIKRKKSKQNKKQKQKEKRQKTVKRCRQIRKTKRKI